MEATRSTMRPRLATYGSLLGCVGCVLWFALADHRHLGSPLALVLFAGGLIAIIGAAKSEHTIAFSGSFIASMLALGLLGPAAAVLIEVSAELTAWVLLRYRRAALSINIFSVAVPLIAIGTVFQATSAKPTDLDFYVALAIASFAALLLNMGMVAWFMAWLDREPVMPSFRALLKFVPAASINVVLAVTAAAIYQSVGFAAVVFVLVSIFGFTYMARLVVTARERASKYAALSWGVLSGLIRTLDLRDKRAARHAAAVAGFARDIAKSCGMTPQECELAHTAGLLHDIGRFGLSDRVMERGRTLTSEDWDSIRRHPELGEDLLRDLGAYGPVAELVRAHHERIDGRGYPDGRTGDDIPELAKILAVAEVYDTLTADDTYRSPMSSFEALTELRRVSGNQVEARYVEALAQLLAGRGTEYRHADAADFDRELDFERRINDALGVDPDGADVAASQ